MKKLVWSGKSISFANGKRYAFMYEKRHLNIRLLTDKQALAIIQLRVNEFKNAKKIAELLEK